MKSIADESCTTDDRVEVRKSIGGGVCDKVGESVLESRYHPRPDQHRSFEVCCSTRDNFLLVTLPEYHRLPTSNLTYS